MNSPPISSSTSHGNPPALSLRGVRVRNLQGIDVELPANSLVVITGVNGAGKTSLAIETLAAEGQRRFMETFPVSSRRYLERWERPAADEIGPLPPAIILRRGHGRPGRRTTVATLSEVNQTLQQLFTQAGQVVCPDCHLPVAAHSATSIAREIATWPEGIRFQIGFQRERQADEVPDVLASELMEAGFQRVILDGQVHTLKIPLPGDWSASRNWTVVVDRLQTGKLSAERLHDSLEQALQRGLGSCLLVVHDASQTCGRETVVEGADCREVHFHTRLKCGGCDREFASPSPRLFSFHSSQGACPRCQGVGEVAGAECATCHGQRLNSDALAVQFRGMNCGEFQALTIDQALHTCENWLVDSQADMAGRWLIQLRERLELLQRLGWGYLSLGRAGRTLSTGEVQGLSLAAICAVRLVEAMYVLDEPAAGLHPSAVERLITILRELQGRRNSVIVVEHSASLIRAADAVIDLGPGAGPEGGRVIYQGGPNGLAECADSMTGSYLSGRTRLERRRTRTPNGWLNCTGIEHRSLHDFNVQFPLGVLCTVTGASGTGKSTLIAETLYPALRTALGQALPEGEFGTMRQLNGADALQAVVYVDQSPPDKVSRSNVATASGMWAEIRAILAATPEAKIRQFTARTFSFHSAGGGRCTTCEGVGTLAVDLQFLADLQVTCPDCHGTRFQREVLEVKYRGLSVAEILQMTVSQALPFFRGRSRLQRRLKVLKDVGLGYLELGQPAASLSGGEIQRLQLAAQMTTRPVGATLYLLDEPARGLHPADIQGLLNWFDDLLNEGHSLIIIEHRPEVITLADHVIEMPRN